MENINCIFEKIMLKVNNLDHCLSNNLFYFLLVVKPAKLRLSLVKTM